MIKDLELTKECLTEEAKGRRLPWRRSCNCSSDGAHTLLTIYIPLPPLLNYSTLRNGTAGSQRQHCISCHGHMQHLYHRTMPSPLLSQLLSHQGAQPGASLTQLPTAPLLAGMFPSAIIYLLQCNVKGIYKAGEANTLK